MYFNNTQCNEEINNVCKFFSVINSLLNTVSLPKLWFGQICILQIEHTIYTLRSSDRGHWRYRFRELFAFVSQRFKFSGKRDLKLDCKGKLIPCQLFSTHLVKRFSMAGRISSVDKTSKNLCLQDFRLFPRVSHNRSVELNEVNRRNEFKAIASIKKCPNCTKHWNDQILPSDDEKFSWSPADDTWLLLASVINSSSEEKSEEMGCDHRM